MREYTIVRFRLVSFCSITTKANHVMVGQAVVSRKFNLFFQRPPISSQIVIHRQSRVILYSIIDISRINKRAIFLAKRLLSGVSKPLVSIIYVRLNKCDCLIHTYLFPRVDHVLPFAASARHSSERPSTFCEMAAMDLGFGELGLGNRTPSLSENGT